MILNATGTGLFFKTMLYLANQTTDPNPNTMQDFYNTAMGAEMGKCQKWNIQINLISSDSK